MTVLKSLQALHQQKVLVPKKYTKTHDRCPEPPRASGLLKWDLVAATAEGIPTRESCPAGQLFYPEAGDKARLRV
jgi:hypothetical protein